MKHYFVKTPDRNLQTLQGTIMALIIADILEKKNELEIESNSDYEDEKLKKQLKKIWNSF